MFGAGQIFMLIFITLGPLKVLGPFAHQTSGMATAVVRGIAWRVFVLSLIAVTLGGLGGRLLIAKWQVSMPSLLISTGVIFFLVALQLVMEQYEPPKESAATKLPDDPMKAALKITFPTVVTPYGIATLIALLAAPDIAVSEVLIWVILFGVMCLNLVAMLSAHVVMRGFVVLALRLVGAVLAVLQVALAVQIIVLALHKSNVLPPP